MFVRPLAFAMMLAATILAGTVAAASAQSSSVPASPIAVTNAWARATPAGAAAGAAYLTIESPASDRLLAVSAPVAKEASLHTMTMEGGVMKMRPLDGIDLPAGQAVMLRPGGMHIMLTGLAGPLKEGQSFPLTLNFAKSGTQKITVTIGKIGAMGPPGTAAD